MKKKKFKTNVATKNRYVRWTDNEVLRAKRYLEEGHTLQMAADLLRRETKTLRRKLRGQRFPRWTEGELEILRANIHLGIPHCADLLQRKEKSIYNKAHRLGLLARKRAKKVANTPNAIRCKRYRSKRYKPKWSKTELDILHNSLNIRDAYNNLSRFRSRRAIILKWKRLGLKSKLK